MRSHLDRLDAAGRLARFGHRPSDRSLDIYAADCVCEATTVFGFFEADVLHGIGELRLGARDSRRRGCDGELAFSVEAQWRRRGIGHRLMRKLVRAARVRNVSRLELTCAIDNEAMLALARGYASSLTCDGDEVTAALSIETTGIGNRVRTAATRYGVGLAGLGRDVVARLAAPRPPRSTRADVAQ